MLTNNSHSTVDSTNYSTVALEELRSESLANHTPLIRLQGSEVHASICCCSTCSNLPINQQPVIAPITSSIPPLNSLPLLSSNPNATAKIFLDFDGNVTSGTVWNSFYSNGNDLITPPYSLDTDTSSFSTTELETITEIWQRVAEDFAPFNVDITTIEPSDFSATEAIRVVIGGSSQDWYDFAAGGLAFVDSWRWDGDTPVFVFEDNLANGDPKFTAEASSHEIGHALGLEHQSTYDANGNKTNEYNPGSGSGETGWAPIMGVGYNQNLTTWHNGPNTIGANNFQDDMSIIASIENGFGYRSDDHGNTNATATVLSSPSFSSSGIIEQMSDVDVFAFTTNGGTLNLNLDLAQVGPNLDLVAELWDSDGNLLATDDPIDQLDAAINISVAAGTYYLHVKSNGEYGRVGTYTISNNIIPQNNTFTGDNFDSGIDDSQWSDISNSLVNTNFGGSGNSLYFSGGSVGDSSRYAITNAIDFSNGGSISFDLIFGNDSNGGENADLGEDVVLEYSLNAGSTWSTINTYGTEVYTSWTTITEAIPLAAQTNNTTLRWRQVTHSGSNYDNWGLDNIVADANNGQIQGTVWDDQNGDGIQDIGELGLANWTVYLDQNQNGELDVGETATTTDTNGNYLFSGLAGDTYYVAQVVQNNWQLTYPSGNNSTATIGPANSLPIITTTDSDIPIYTYGEVVATSDNVITPQTNDSGSLINIDDFRADARFAGIDGSGFATVILDTGIDLDHAFFGPDSDNDGIADRIVYSYDFADGDTNASDLSGHGSNVSSIVASSDSTYTGMAPGADIIHLKVFEDGGAGNFSYVEQALQWVINNAATYNIASVNMSLGDSGNYDTPQALYGIADEMAALATLDIAVVSAAGNDFFSFNSVQGVSYPAADSNSLTVGAVYDSSVGSFNYGDGATAFSTGADQLTPFSQRHQNLTNIFAPGAPITGAGPYGGTVTQHGTSQAAPHIAGIAVLAQQLAQQELGRRLTVTELSDLLHSTGVTINDGDNEDDNTINTGLDFQRVDVLALGEAILNLADGNSGTYAVSLDPGETVEDIDFGNQQIPIVNAGFETGDFTNWNIIGDISIETAAIGSNPTEGTYQALVTTGNNTVSDAELEAFLGLNSGDLDALGNGDAIAGSAMQLTPITVAAGDQLSFDWNFLTNENISIGNNDFGFVSITSEDLGELADITNEFSSFAGSFGLETGSGTFTHEFTTAGTFMVGIGVVDMVNDGVDSALLVDNLVISS
ncbi:MAG: S8 family serine peptidase [Symploca sp. SIO2G7]|nr:S8 family serine peptidase [Symploca sp. SIO2G7]